MSYAEHRILAWVCDEPGCRENFWTEDSTVPGDREDMRERGWVCRRDGHGDLQDFCPKHRPPTAMASCIDPWAEVKP